MPDTAIRGIARRLIDLAAGMRFWPEFFAKIDGSIAMGTQYRQIRTALATFCP